MASTKSPVPLHYSRSVKWVNFGEMDEPQSPPLRVIEMQSNPVFVVGASRSGTTMLQRALSLHSRVHISAETHWFDDLRSRCSTEITTDEERREVQDWFLALSHRPFGYAGEADKGWLSRAELEQAVLQLRDANGKESAVYCDYYLTAFCELDAKRHNKVRWGEKTPRHVFRIGDIHEGFEQAKILCIVRDPRAMVASYSEWSKRANGEIDKETPEQVQEYIRSRASYHPIIAALMWRGAARASIKARQRHGNDVVKLVRYEDLVGQAEPCLRDITEWLGEDFEAPMLDVPMANSSFNNYQAGVGFKSNTGEQWQTTLSKTEQSVVNFLCRKEMKRHNYDTISTTGTGSQLINALSTIPHLLTLPLALWRAVHANQDRTGKLFSYIWRRICP